MAMTNYIDEKRITATVTAVKWERIFLYIDVTLVYQTPEERNGELCFYAVDGMYYAQAKFKVVSQTGDTFRLKLNITNSGENACMPYGEYRLIVCRDDCQMADCETDTAVVGSMSEFSRNFLYSDQTRSYTVTFYVEEDADTLPFRFYILAAAQTNMLFPVKTHLRDKLRIIAAIQSTWGSRKNILRTMYSFFYMLYAKKRRNTILFLSEQNKVIASNLKAVSDRMRERGMDKDYRLLYSARSAAAESQSIKSWVELIQKMAQSGIIFIDDHAPLLDWLKLGDDTKLIQLWHAGAGFKYSG